VSTLGALRENCFKTRAGTFDVEMTLLADSHHESQSTPVGNRCISARATECVSAPTLKRVEFGRRNATVGVGF
jgi:hypothetical protein